MEDQANSKNIILNYGLYLGVIGIIVHLALWATGNVFTLQWVNSVISFVTMIVFIVLGIKQFKGINSGFISWGQGVKIGLGITMISAVIAVVYTLIFTNIIEPTFQQQAMDFQAKAWEDAGLTSDQIEASVAMAEKFNSPAIVSAMILAFSAFVGFVFSAIIAAIMKKSEEETY
ncbi:MAG: hypothetical protein ACI9Q3_000661 [Maribacter sp.]|jgi:hypothetical protein